MSGIAARTRFREAGRQVMRSPRQAGVHAERVHAALDMDGTEPVQGALADMLWACRGAVVGMLDQPAVAARLAPYIACQLRDAGSDDAPVPRVHPLATRWSVLATPSMDVPRRALLSGVDDSRALVAQAVPAILAGDAQMETEFLAHCVGTHDSLAFMLARRALAKAGWPLSGQWRDAGDAIERGVMS